jgi:hypothetical protein
MTYSHFQFGVRSVIVSKARIRGITKRQYPHRLDIFLSYLGFEGTIKN